MAGWYLDWGFFHCWLKRAKFAIGLQSQDPMQCFFWRTEYQKNAIMHFLRKPLSYIKRNKENSCSNFVTLLFFGWWYWCRTDLSAAELSEPLPSDRMASTFFFSTGYWFSREKKVTCHFWQVKKTYFHFCRSVFCVRIWHDVCSA